MNLHFWCMFFPNIITLRLLETIRLINSAFVVYLLLFGGYCLVHCVSNNK